MPFTRCSFMLECESPDHAAIGSALWLDRNEQKDALASALSMSRTLASRTDRRGWLIGPGIDIGNDASLDPCREDRKPSPKRANMPEHYNIFAETCIGHGRCNKIRPIPAITYSHAPSTASNPRRTV